MTQLSTLLKLTVRSEPNRHREGSNFRRQGERFVFQVFAKTVVKRRGSAVSYAARGAGASGIYRRPAAMDIYTQLQEKLDDMSNRITHEAR